MEIENIKTSAQKDEDVKYNARNVSRLLNSHYGKYTVILHSKDVIDVVNDHFLDCTHDNIILATAYMLSKKIPIILVTDDLNMRFVATNVFGLAVKSADSLDLMSDIIDYKGVRDVTLNDDEMSYFYNHLTENQYNSKINEYLIVRKSDGVPVDYRCWNGNEYHEIKYDNANSKFIGKVKPINPQQKLAFDMLQNQNITIKVLTGDQGTGKDFCMVANALSMIEHGKFNKIVYVRNPIGVRDVEKIGYLPGDEEDKLMLSSLGLADILGGIDGLRYAEEQELVSIEYLGAIRGRNFDNSIILCSEAENISKDHAKLLIGRVGKNSELWLNGDDAQVDSACFRHNNGINSMISCFSGNKKFGYVHLEQVERSETARLADLLI